MRRALLGLLFPLLLVPVGCGTKGDPLREPIDRIVAATEKRSAEDVVANFSETYKDVEGWGRAEALVTLKRYFFAYGDLKVDLSNLKIEPAADGAARATFRAAVSGTPKNVGGLAGLLPRSTVLRFELRLVSEDGRYRVAWASWTVESSS